MYKTPAWFGDQELEEGLLFILGDMLEDDEPSAWLGMKPSSEECDEVVPELVVMLIAPFLVTFGAESCGDQCPDYSGVCRSFRNGLASARLRQGLFCNFDGCLRVALHRCWSGVRLCCAHVSYHYFSAQCCEPSCRGACVCIMHSFKDFRGNWSNICQDHMPSVIEDLALDELRIFDNVDEQTEDEQSERRPSILNLLLPLDRKRDEGDYELIGRIEKDLIMIDVCLIVAPFSNWTVELDLYRGKMSTVNVWTRVIERRDDDIPCSLYNYLLRAAHYDRYGFICEIRFLDPGAVWQLANRNQM
jgi:hypothetical protein